jgi:LacI family transcriptional regulator
MGDGDNVPARPRRPTIRQLAEHTGLSPAAVSYALRGLQVSPETQARVQAAAEELGFRTDPIARALRGGETKSVGMVVGSLADLYLQELVAGVQRHLRAGGRQLLIADADGDPSIEVELALELADRRVDALIVSPIGPFSKGWSAVAKQVPTVSIGERLPGAATAGQVLFDHESAVRAVLEHLA